MARTSTLRGRRLAAVALALPLALSLTGSALASGPAAQLQRPAQAQAEDSDQSGSSSTQAVERGKSADARAEQPQADKKTEPQAPPAAPSEKKAERAAEPQAAKAEPQAQKSEPAAPKSAPQASKKAEPAPAETRSSFINDNANSSKDERPNAPVAGTPSQPISNADSTGSGANPGSDVECEDQNPYCSNGTGKPSGNGVGGGEAKGKPCAGCVGKADNKNPPGQAPGGSDHNAGYECDRNQGIGKTNPAHTGCTSVTPVTDLCPDVPGTQTSTPCVVVTDLCPDVPGTQTSTPCVVVTDLCPDVPGTQTSTPCVVVTDLCPDVPGTQTSTPCVVVTDVCPEQPGNQPSGTVCQIDGENEEPGTGPICPAGSTPGPNGTCQVPVVCPAGSTLAADGRTCVLPDGGGNELPTCPTGSTMAPDGKTCVFPSNAGPCPDEVVMGPLLTVCGPTFGGTTPGQPGSAPVTPPGFESSPTIGGDTKAPGVIGNGSTPREIAQGRVVPSALPFTGADLALVLALGTVLVLGGGGFQIAARRESAARAAA